MLVKHRRRKLDWNSLDLVNADPGKLPCCSYHVRTLEECRASHERCNEVGVSRIASDIERELVD